MVAMAAIFRKLGRVFSRVRAGSRRFEHGLRQLQRDGRAAQRFFRVRAAGLVGIENGQRVRNRIAGFRQVMVGDDQVEAQPARGLRFGKGAHAGVDGDHQAHALGVRRFEHARLQAVALAQAVRHMKARRRRPASRWRS